MEFKEFKNIFEGCKKKGLSISDIREKALMSGLSKNEIDNYLSRILKKTNKKKASNTILITIAVLILSILSIFGFKIFLSNERVINSISTENGESFKDSGQLQKSKNKNNSDTIEKTAINDIEECISSVSDPVEKTKCYSKIAIVTKDPSYCAKIFNYAEKTIPTGTETWTPSFLEHICYLDLIRDAGLTDPELCSKSTIPNGDQQYWCYTVLAEKTRNDTFCEKYNDLDMTSFDKKGLDKVILKCRRGANNYNLEKCLDLSESFRADLNCFSRIAVEKKDIKYCSQLWEYGQNNLPSNNRENEIISLGNREWDCYFAIIGRANLTKEDCDLMHDTPAKKVCYKTIE